MLWLAAWGFFTALSRMTALGVAEGLSEYIEFLIRISHVIAPLVLWRLLTAMYPPAQPQVASIAKSPTREFSC